MYGICPEFYLTKRRLFIQIDPRITRLSFKSKILGVLKSFYIYLPPGYNEPQNQVLKYPVLYLFRGHEREWVNLHEDKSREGRSIVDVYLQALEQGQVGPMILVCPGITSDDQRVPGLLVNFKQPELAKGSRGVGTGQFQDFFISELIPYVDRNYRTAGAAHRAVDGFSLGGFQAIKIAAQYPGMFVSAGAYDGTFFYADPTGAEVSQADALFRAGLFDPVFGRPRDFTFAARHNPANLILNSSPEALSRVFWMVQTGPEAAEPSDANFYRGRYIAGLLEEKGAANRVPLVIPDGRHNWATADRHMAITLPYHWQALSGTPVLPQTNIVS
jgi:S-formylglutathione hydrolase FrmB